VGDTMRVGLNKSTRPPLVVGFLPRKKGDTAVTNNVAFMTTIFLFLSIWFFFSLCWIFRLRRLCWLCTGECVCIHTQAIQAVSSLDRFPIFLLLLRWGSF
jgi:hypothetical protein